ncbi:MAG: 50S ribosomal protein L17 [Vicinamibacterales bacterium]
MRHKVAHRKLGRVSEHRIALLRNQAEALLRHERIRTTVPKAKEVRTFVEHLITVAKRGNAAAADGGQAAALHARRLVLRDIPDKQVVSKLFREVAPRFTGRPGGYTRILRIGYRRGDSAEMAQLELVGSEFNPKAAAEKKAARETEKKGMGARLRARLRRRGAAGEGEETPEPKA